jgi:hypothetical protein
MAFRIQDLSIQLTPATGRTVMWATCPDITDIKSDCPTPSCGPQCKPHSCGEPSHRPPKPPSGIRTAPAGLLLLRLQLHETLAQDR